MNTFEERKRESECSLDKDIFMQSAFRYSVEQKSDRWQLPSYVPPWDSRWIISLQDDVLDSLRQQWKTTSRTMGTLSSAALVRKISHQNTSPRRSEHASIRRDKSRSTVRHSARERFERPTTKIFVGYSRQQALHVPSMFHKHWPWQSHDQFSWCPVRQQESSKSSSHRVVLACVHSSISWHRRGSRGGKLRAQVPTVALQCNLDDASTRQWSVVAEDEVHEMRTGLFAEGLLFWIQLVQRNPKRPFLALHNSTDLFPPAPLWIFSCFLCPLMRTIRTLTVAPPQFSVARFRQDCTDFLTELCIAKVEQLRICGTGFKEPDVEDTYLRGAIKFLWSEK